MATFFVGLSNVVWQQFQERLEFRLPVALSSWQCFATEQGGQSAISACASESMHETVLCESLV